MRRIALTLAILTMAAFQTVPAAAAYPERPIKLIAAFAPGGSLDLVSRILADQLTVALGQPVVVENRVGAAGNIAAQAVAAADPDGYTILATTSALTISPWLTNSSFNAVKSLAAVTRPAVASYVLVVPASSPAKTFDDFLAAAKAEPKKLTCMSYGVGSPPHLALELLKQAAGVDITHVPYRGFGLALGDLTNGLLSCGIDTPANVGPHVESGAVRAIAVTTKTPIPTFPAATPIAARFPSVEVEGWQGIFVPAATPRPILERLNAEIVKIITRPEIVEKLKAVGFDVVGDSVDSASAVFQRDHQRFGDLIKTLNLRSP